MKKTLPLSLKACLLFFLTFWQTLTSQAQVTSGLIQEFNFNNSYTSQSGTATFGSNVGTSFVTDRKGNVNAAININNTGAIATITGLPYGSAARSVSIWVKLNTVNANGYNMFYVYGQSSLSNVNGGGSSQNVAFHFGYNNNHEVADNNTQNTWNNFVFVYDGTASKIYKNGFLLGTQNIAWNTLNNSDLFKIGTGPGNELWFNGAIDDLKIFNRALSANEVSALYDPAPVQEWSFDGTYASKANTYPFLSNTGTFFTTNRFNVANKALVINNTGTYVNGGVAGLPSGNSPRTVSFWLSRNQTGTFQEIFVYGSSGSNFSFGLNIAANETMMLYNYNFGSVYSPLTSSVIPTGITWAHIAVVWTGDSAKIYRNGLLRVSTAVTTPLATPSGNVSLLLGRVLTVASTPFNGAIDDLKIYAKALSQNEISALYQAESVLPLTLTSFTANLTNKTTQLNWASSQEINTSHFEVEYSKDGKDFEKVATVAASGNSSITQNYTAYHTVAVQAKHYYRLKMIDKDGKYTYSQVVVVNASNTQALSVVLQGTQVQNQLQFTVTSNKAITVNIAVTNSVGQMILQPNKKSISAGSNSFSYIINNFSSGVYFLEMVDESGLKQVVKFLK